ncbi:MAG: VWA domain-containing protein [Acidobacteria bacterium]|nr:VWA domain-containing protein [Acidobacteriota bacterium]
MANVARAVRTVLALVLSAPLAAQVVIGAENRSGVIRVDVDLVNVLCSVRDRSGGWATGLGRGDFEVREDGRSREITHFAADTDSPMTVALMVDVSGSVSGILGVERDAARRFLEEVLRPGDRALVGGFGSTIPIWQDLTDSAAALRAGLEQMSGRADYGEGARPRGGTLLYDAVTLVSTRKLAEQAGRKTLVLITDGVDNGSTAKPGEAVKAAQQADAVVFAIHYTPQSRGFAMGHGELERLARATGGRVFEVGEKMPLERAFGEIAEEMRHQYSLGFAPAKRDGEYHKLEVRVKPPGMKAAAREGYWAR